MFCSCWSARAPSTRPSNAIATVSGLIPPGRLVDVGGYRLHIYCTGEGSPTAILEAGGGNPWLAWYKVQPKVAEFTRVCSYDRAGLGWSDASPKPPTAEAIAEDLHTLLRNAGRGEAGAIQEDRRRY